MDGLTQSRSSDASGARVEDLFDGTSVGYACLLKIFGLPDGRRKTGGLLEVRGRGIVATNPCNCKTAVNVCF